MLLNEAIAAAGMTPPAHFPIGKFVRFPGCGKKRGNTAGWCKRLSATHAVYGDWSTGLSEIWQDDAHRDDSQAKRLAAEAKEQARQRFLEEVRGANETAERAQRMLGEAKEDTHPYLIAKGFKHSLGLVRDGELLIGMHAVEDYRLINLQRIAVDGTKKFLAGGRAKGAIHRLGRGPRIALCEGYATGLSVQAALTLLPGLWTVVVCFSAGNLVAVAPEFPHAIVCADHDESGVGEKAARETDLKWVMPPEPGDFNDLHGGTVRGLNRVKEILREVCIS